MKNGWMILTLFFCSGAYAFNTQLDIKINSFEDAIGYIKAAYSISKSKSCLITDVQSNQYESIKNTTNLSFEISDQVLLNKVIEVKEENCHVLASIFDTVMKNKQEIFKSYPIPDMNELKILSIDKNSAAHNIIVGGAIKGKWVVCYGLNSSGIPLAKKSALVKDKYTVINVRSHEHHDEIMSYECDYEG